MLIIFHFLHHVVLRASEQEQPAGLQQIDIPPLLHLQQEADINLMADKKNRA